MQIENWHGYERVYECVCKLWLVCGSSGPGAEYEHGRGQTISDFCRIFSATMFHFWAAKEAIVWCVTGCEWMLGARVKLVDAIVSKCLNWQQSLAHLMICWNGVILNSLIPCHYSLDYNFVSLHILTVCTCVQCSVKLWSTHVQSVHTGVCLHFMLSLARAFVQSRGHTLHDSFQWHYSLKLLNRSWTFCSNSDISMDREN